MPAAASNAMRRRSKTEPVQRRSNVHRDPFRTGNSSQFIERNTPHVFAPGAIQRLAEEMTDALAADQQRLVNDVCRIGGTRTRHPRCEGGQLRHASAPRARRRTPCVGHVQHRQRARRRLPAVGRQPGGAGRARSSGRSSGKAACRSCATSTAAPAHNELGMQAVEIVGDNVDGDFDGVTQRVDDRRHDRARRVHGGAASANNAARAQLPWGCWSRR